MPERCMINHDYLARYIDEIHSFAELCGKLDSRRALRIKFGVDCTAPDLHLGHAVNLWVMRHLQECGHRVQLLIGDFTSRVGDPTGRIKSRPALTQEEIEANGRAFLNQIGMVLHTDASVFEVLHNRDWYDAMPTHELLSIMGLVTTARLEARETYRKRRVEGQEVRLHEFIYPLLQAYDSVAMKSDVAPVGTDQLFNEMLGRELQQKYGVEKQVVITTKITPGLCGKDKQSKSKGNYVALTDSPRDMFGKVMSLPDALIPQWLEVYTEVPMDDVITLRKNLIEGSMNARDAKLILARSIVERYHGLEKARSEEAWFVETFSRCRVPENVPQITLAAHSTVLDVLRHVLPGKSNSEYRRLCAGGGVRIGNASDETGAFQKLTDTHARVPVDEGTVLKVGKKDFFRLATSS